MTKAKAAALAAQIAQTNTSLSLQAPSTGSTVLQKAAISPNPRSETPSARAYANMQKADMNSLPWDFFAADFAEASAFGQDNDEFIGDVQFDQVMSIMDPSYDLGQVSDAALHDTVSPGAYFMN